MGWAGDVSSNPCCWRDASSSCWAGTSPTSSTTQTLRWVCRCGVLSRTFREGWGGRGMFLLIHAAGEMQVPHAGLEPSL